MTFIWKKRTNELVRKCVACIVSFKYNHTHYTKISKDTAAHIWQFNLVAKIVVLEIESKSWQNKLNEDQLITMRFVRFPFIKSCS